MSPWRPDRLRVELAPERVQVLRLPRAWPRSAGEHWQAPPAPPRLPSEAEPPWLGALAALRAGLDAVSHAQRASLRVRLSNRFVRYSVVPWADDLRSEAEVAAFARHRLRETYGDIAETWEIRLGAGWPGVPRVAAAVDRNLIEALAELAQASGLRLRAVEPHFAMIVDEHRRQLRGPAFWLAVHESARIVLARVVGGEWRSLVAARVAGAAAATVAAMLTRETVALVASEAPQRIYLYGIDANESERLVDAGWDVVRLRQPASAAEGLSG